MRKLRSVARLVQGYYIQNLNNNKIEEKLQQKIFDFLITNVEK